MTVMMFYSIEMQLTAVGYGRSNFYNINYTRSYKNFSIGFCDSKFFDLILPLKNF